MLVFSFTPNKLDKSKISFSFLVLEVAIGEYGITVDKLITAVDKHWENEKIVAAPIKPELEGNFQTVVTAEMDFLIQSDYYNCFVFWQLEARNHHRLPVFWANVIYYTKDN